MHKSAVILLFVSILLGGVILSTVLVAEPTEPKLETKSTLTLKEKLFWAMRTETPAQSIVQVLEEHILSFRGD